ncbi:MAG: lactate/malate family dehydrogenase [Thermodesulfobacteriota bacterium]
MAQMELERGCFLVPRPREMDRIGVWGFGNVSRDVVVFLVDEGLGKEIVLYGRPQKDYPNRAAAWIEDLKANSTRRPRLVGTNKVEDMAGLDVIFVGVGVPRKEGQSRRDLLRVNTEIIAQTSLEIRRLYGGCDPEKLPVLIYMGNPVTTMTWVGYKASGFPRQKVMGQAGNLDARRVCYALAKELGISGNEMRGIVFGDHGDSMVVSSRFFSVGGIPLDLLLEIKGVAPSRLTEILEQAKKGGTHFVEATGHSASVGPAKAAGEMLRAVISGEPEIQPVVAILEKEYGLIEPQDGIQSMGFGVPAKIGPGGVEEIYELEVEDIREALRASAAPIKEDTRIAADILREKFSIE